MAKGMLLDAGQGSRVRTLSKELPKPMVPILGKPVMDYLIAHLARYGITEIMINVAYHHKKIEEWRRAEAERLTAERRPDLIVQGRTIETHAGLRIFGDDLDPDELTSLLGGNPTDSFRKGDLKRSGHPHRSGGWLLDSDFADGDQLTSQIRLILGRLTSDLAIWRQVVDRFQVDMFCGVWLIGKPGISVEPTIMKLLGDRGIKLALDINKDSAVTP